MQQQLPELDKKTKLCAVSLCHFPESDKQSFCGAWHWAGVEQGAIVLVKVAEYCSDLIIQVNHISNTQCAFTCSCVYYNK